MQGNLCYFIFNIRNVTFGLDLVLFSPTEIIWALGYHVALMEEIVKPKEETVFGCFVRVICMTSVGKVGSHSMSLGKPA